MKKRKKKYRLKSEMFLKAFYFMKKNIMKEPRSF